MRMQIDCSPEDSRDLVQQVFHLPPRILGAMGIFLGSMISYCLILPLFGLVGGINETWIDLEIYGFEKYWYPVLYLVGYVLISLLIMVFSPLLAMSDAVYFFTDFTNQ